MTLARTHTERRRAESFGEDADGYDRVRPSYPSEVIDELVGPSTHRVLDVGCGTGKMARQLRDRGCDVLGVEVDERMAAIARRDGLTVEISKFEEWDGAGRRFDLVVSAQAWHWVDPIAGPIHAADLLDAGGRLALVWNYRTSLGPQGDEVVGACYSEHAPELIRGTLLGTFNRDEENASVVASVQASGRYDEVTSHRVTWQQRYTRDEWLALAATQSDHRTLDPATRERLMSAVGAAIDGIGGSLDVSYETICIMAPLA